MAKRPYGLSWVLVSWIIGNRPRSPGPTRSRVHEAPGPQSPVSTLYIIGFGLGLYKRVFIRNVDPRDLVDPRLRGHQPDYHRGELIYFVLDGVRIRSGKVRISPSPRGGVLGSEVFGARCASVDHSSSCRAIVEVTTKHLHWSVYPTETTGQ